MTADVDPALRQIRPHNAVVDPISNDGRDVVSNRSEHGQIQARVDAPEAVATDHSAMI